MLFKYFIQRFIKNAYIILTMTTTSLEHKIIQLLLQDPPYTIEEIKHIINEKRDDDDKMSMIEIEEWITQCQTKARLQKSINDKKSKRKSNAMINDMQTLISDLREMIHKLQNEDATSKTIVQALKELRLTIMDIATLAGELKKQQELDISHYYIPINKIEEYLKKREKKSEKNSEK